MNISSLLIRTLPENVEEVIKQLKASGLCEYHFHNTAEGKIVITLEGKDSAEEINKHNKIAQMPKIIAADMVETYSEEELDSERTLLESSPKVPEMLNNENLRAEDIVYHGDLRKVII